MRSRRDGNSLRLLLGIGMALFALVSYFLSAEVNPITGERQYVGLTPQQEIQLGLQSAPQLIQQSGGELRNASAQEFIDDLGFRLVRSSVAADTPWQWEFTVLDNDATVNAFALPGGQVFITTALLNRLDDEAEVAGVIGHEIGHVLARHGAQRIAQSNLTNGLIGAVGVASGDANAQQTAAVIGQLVNMQYGRDDEIESDRLGVCIMIDAGYDPNELVDVMRVLEEASGGSRQPEFFSTHPSPDNRVQRIEEVIRNADTECPS